MAALILNKSESPLPPQTQHHGHTVGSTACWSTVCRIGKGNALRLETVLFPPLTLTSKPNGRINSWLRGKRPSEEQQKVIACTMHYRADVKGHVAATSCKQSPAVPIFLAASGALHAGNLREGTGGRGAAFTPYPPITPQIPAVFSIPPAAHTLGASF